MSYTIGCNDPISIIFICCSPPSPTLCLGNYFSGKTSAGKKTDGGHNYNTGRGQQRVSSVTISNNKIVFCYNSLIGRRLGKMYEIMWHQMKWKCTCTVCCREKNIWRYWIGKKMHWINTMNQIGFHKTDAFDRLKRVQYFIPFLKISQSNFCLPFVPELNKNSWCWQKTPDI